MITYFAKIIAVIINKFKKIMLSIYTIQVLFSEIILLLKFMWALIFKWTICPINNSISPCRKSLCWINISCNLACLQIFCHILLTFVYLESWTKFIIMPFFENCQHSFLVFFINNLTFYFQIKFKTFFFLSKRIIV
jgi:hypothetical protein